ncbi:hypothetical protein Bca4012_010031 [Brassica carinata]
MYGLPLALQLVAYEAIPQLLSRLGGNDELKLLDCERFPQHTGLNLVDVLEAEHNPEELGRRKRTGVTPRKERFSSGKSLRKQKKRAAVAEEESLSDEEKEEHADNPKDASNPEGDVAPARETAPDGSEDGSMADGRGKAEMG